MYLRQFITFWEFESKQNFKDVNFKQFVMKCNLWVVDLCKYFWEDPVSIVKAFICQSNPHLISFCGAYYLVLTTCLVLGILGVCNNVGGRWSATTNTHTKEKLDLDNGAALCNHHYMPLPSFTMHTKKASFWFCIPPLISCQANSEIKNFLKWSR